EEEGGEEEEEEEEEEEVCFAASTDLAHTPPQLAVGGESRGRGHTKRCYSHAHFHWCRALRKPQPERATAVPRRRPGSASGGPDSFSHAAHERVAPLQPARAVDEEEEEEEEQEEEEEEARA
ncbi:unnamed protein product, partial [Prorocentrum cordatum]